MYNDHIANLVNGWWDFFKRRIIFKGLSNENNPPWKFPLFYIIIFA
jgi:hypothetical protein